MTQVIYLEDDDVAAVCDTGALTIHRISRSVEMETPESREIITLKMEIQQIMKGSYSTFMQKEICEQPESVVNTMRGRVSYSITSEYDVSLRAIQGQLRGRECCPRRNQVLRARNPEVSTSFADRLWHLLPLRDRHQVDLA